MKTMATEFTLQSTTQNKFCLTKTQLKCSSNIVVINEIKAQ